MTDSQTTYHCREFGVDVYGADMAALLSDRGYVVTARTEVHG
jgi:hypothetical protein